jgi:hypothetical protein
MKFAKAAQQVIKKNAGGFREMGKNMTAEFVSYAFQDTSRKKIKKYALQYAGVDMAAVIGADEENLPFLIRHDAECDDDEPGAFLVMCWNTYNGIMARLDEDPVREYAVVKYLREHGYPAFANFAEAEKWAIDHNWPRKARAKL